MLGATQVSTVFHATLLYLIPTIVPVSTIESGFLTNWGLVRFGGRLDGYFDGWQWVMVHFL